MLVERYATDVTTRAQAPRSRTASQHVSDHLLGAALQILEDFGIAALTVRAVANKAEVAPMGVYSRFGNKDGLLEALFVHGFVGLRGAIEPSLGNSQLSMLRAGCLGYRRYAIAHPQLYHLMFEQMMMLELSPQATDVARDTFYVLVDRVHACMASGELQQADSVEVAQQIWSAMHGAVSLEIADVHFANDPATNFTRMLEALLAGLGSIT